MIIFNNFRLILVLTINPLDKLLPSINKFNIRTNKAVIATSGMQADQKALHKLLATRIKSYDYVHRKKMSTPAIAQMLANTLYYKRFFPYYTFNVLGGIDEQGKFQQSGSHSKLLKLTIHVVRYVLTRNIRKRMRIFIWCCWFLWKSRILNIRIWSWIDPAFAR